MGLGRTILLMIAVQIAFSINGCASHKTAFPKPSPLQEKKAERRGVYHLVERHQTLYRICRTYGADIHEVASLNGITDQDKIRTGQRIFVPGAKKVLKVEIYINDVLLESGEKEREKPVHRQFHFAWPVDGRFGDLFEETESRRHQGIDILSPCGTPIRAAGAGVVLYSGNTIRGYGNLIILRHSEELVTVYAHNQVNLVEEGVRVEEGEIIGRVGRTGKASGPHLHFEIRRQNRPIDPLLFLD